MKTAEERFRTDPLFAAIVNQMYAMFNEYCGSGAGITPSEIREASGFAWQMYAERNIAPIPVIQKGDK